MTLEKNLMLKIDRIVENIYKKELLKGPLEEKIFELNKTLFKKIASAYLRADVSFGCIIKLKNDNNIYTKNKKLIDKHYEIYRKIFIYLDQSIENIYESIEG